MFPETVKEIPIPDSELHVLYAVEIHILSSEANSSLPATLNEVLMVKANSPIYYADN